jgi:cob(I)alamin adenosyltransferase
LGGLSRGCASVARAPAPAPASWWNVFGRLDELTAFLAEEREKTMAQIDDLKAAQARLIDANRRLLAKIAELQAGQVDPAELAALTSEANNAAAAAESVAPPPASS